MALAFDFDDDVFIGREERVIVRQTSYTAKEDTDGVSQETFQGGLSTDGLKPCPDLK